MEKLRLCFGCMETLGNSEKVCHHCGYNNNATYNKSYIAPETILHEKRYTMGKVLSYNGESALYIAYDNVMGCKVQVREYMPINLCVRNENSSEIIIKDNFCVQYKSMMAEFTELNRSLVKLRNVGNITPVLDLFTENNTSYAVYEYTDGIRLIDYLKDNMGELSWEETSKLFPPLLTTLGMLHQAGIIHRAISPNTIYYTSRKELRLTDFCISSVRTKDTELNAELYKGYSAPEQYVISGKQGTWTDVYGISAVLYKVLTGCMPTESINRIEHDNLCSPTDINLDIPESVSNAIMEGMNIEIDGRISTVTDLVTKLFDNNEKKENFSSTIKIPRTLVTNDEKTSKPMPSPSTEKDLNEEMAEEPQGSLFDKIKFPLMIGVLLLAIVLVLGIVFVNMFSNSDGIDSTNSTLQHNNEYKDDNVVEVTDTTSSVGITYVMKNLIGKDIDDVLEDEDIKDKINFEIEYAYSDEYESGLIFEQSVATGEKYSEGDTIKVTVSKGPKTIEIPDYKTGTMSCYTKEDYIKILESKGIPYELISVVNRGYYSGYVIGIEPSAGEMLDIEAGEVLKVTYTDNPEVAETTKYVVTTYEETEQAQTYSYTNTYSSTDYVSTTVANNSSSSSNSSTSSNTVAQTETQQQTEPVQTESPVTNAPATEAPATEAPQQQETVANDLSADEN
ncbi:MAG: PASTA domain-containing protein [Ruminococcus sp.]|nr:PASTA domain-containing protein [Ruminococcus sp.]